MWQKDVEEILAKSEQKPEVDWQKIIEQLMPLLHVIVLMSVGMETINSPEARQEIRTALTELGLPQEGIEEAINWLIMSTTKPIK